MSQDIVRDSMQFDVVIVGAGPSGLSAAIRLKQLAQEQNKEINICVVEKGSEVGAHIISGAIMDPKAITELIPNWKDLGAPLTCEVKQDRLMFLTKNKAFKLPTPPSFHNENNYIIGLGLVCKWLAEQAENMGVEIYPGFPAAEVLYHEDGTVKGILTGDMGVGADGKPTDAYQPGMELLAQQTIFSEGCRGSLTKTLLRKFNLDKDSDVQTYGIGIKEIWEVPENQHQEGLVMHTVGWPLPMNVYGGSFMYHMQDNKIYIGYVIGLDYNNPYMSPFEEFQRYKLHPEIKKYLEGGRRISYGARAINEGGFQSLPKLSFPGGVLVGDAAGFLNVPRIKGSHTAIKSGMLAAEAVWDVLEPSQESYTTSKEATSYQKLFEQSWLYTELKAVRNYRPAFKWTLWPAMAYSGLEDYFLKGRGSWTIKHHKADNESLLSKHKAKKIDYPKPDGKISFDRLSSVFLSSTNHEENQPCHLKLSNPEVAISVNYKVYDSPETRYCPAGVYEIVEEEGKPRLQINSQNCLHCKTCDIKDPTQNITWTCPEGGGGPNYSAM
ncbi:MAG: electron transfer flavoprotein-ubiquinone oxidoreductase [Neisseriaceae bacterium]|nr:electron transfer flavoprotein-ubiquinone oxidoreductase [Neisseriaceae bacterium]